MQQYPRIAMSEIKALYRPGPGRHWFDESTMVFFRTVLPGYGLRTPLGNFFVTRETGPSGKRRFSIRVQAETGDIDTVGKFHTFYTPHEAEEGLRTHLETLEGQHA